MGGMCVGFLSSMCAGMEEVFALHADGLIFHPPLLVSQTNEADSVY